MRLKKLTVIYMVIILLLLSLSSSIVFAESNTGLDGFVTRLYRLTLEREPDSGGLDYWVKELQLENKTGADVSLNFIFSNEFLKKNLNSDVFLDIMYRSFFDREPDPSGTKFWTDKMNGGYSRKYILANFVNSKEFSNICLTYSINPGVVKLSDTDKAPSLPVKSLEPSEIAKLYGPAVVYIETYNSSGQLLGSGSGFIASSDGKIVTNYHVIDGSAQAKIFLEDGSSYNVDYVTGYDIGRDVAVLKINATNLLKVRLGTSDLISTGQRVVAIGSPFGLSNTISEGLISNKNRYINDYNHIQTSAAVSPGSSGGALFNQYGEVIGVITWGVIDGQNLNFAIPINEVKAYINSGDRITLTELLVRNDPIATEAVEFYETERNSDISFADIVKNNFYGQNVYQIFGTITDNYFDLDMYKFVVSVPGTFSIYGIWMDSNLRGLEDDLSISILDMYGNAIQYGLTQGSGDEKYRSLDQLVEPGTYYINVFQRRDKSNYHVGSSYGLEVNFHSVANIQTQGKTTQTFDDGSIYIGDMQNGLMHGTGIYSWTNGDRYIGSWINGKRNGIGTYFWPDGSIFYGAWENDIMMGFGAFTWANGDQYQGAWKNDKMNGSGVWISASGQVTKGMWIDDVYQGQY